MKKFILALFFSISIMLSFNCENKICLSSYVNNTEQSVNVEQRTTIKNQLTNARNKMNEVVDSYEASQIERKVEELRVNGKSNSKMSLNSLNANNQILDACDTSLYLGQLSLFDRNSSIIRSSAKDKLTKVANIMQGLSGTKSFIITGHADQTGDLNPDGSVNPVGYANNIKISKKRAYAVANWLIDNKLIAKERLVIIGAGSSEPITNSPDMEEQKLNIRVEIRLNCLYEN